MPTDGGLIPFFLHSYSGWGDSWARSYGRPKRYLHSMLPADERKKRNKERKRVQKARRKGR